MTATTLGALGGTSTDAVFAEECHTAHATPTARKSAAPSAGSQAGVLGSSSIAAAAVFSDSLMRGVFETSEQHFCQARCDRVFGCELPWALPSHRRVPDRHLHGCRAIMSAVNQSLLASGVVIAWICTASPAAAQPPPSLPAMPQDEAAATGADSGGSPASGQAQSPQQLYEHVRRSVVTIVRSGVPVAVGTVLAGDGRILTALSGLGGFEGADVRYADGTVVHTKIGRSDKAFDLALLVPEPNHGTEGLGASESDPAGLDIRAMLPAHGVHLGPAAAALRGWTSAYAPGSERLLQMLAVNVQGPPLAGAPLLDPSGGVVAVLVRACKSGESESGDAISTRNTAVNAAAVACQPIVVGAPVSTIRSFLTHAIRLPSSATSTSSAAWLGVRVEREASTVVRGVRVIAVAPSGPAEQAGLKPSSDVIVAIDGRPIGTPEALAEAISQHAPGDAVKLLVFSAGQFHDLPVVLRAAL